MRLLTGGLTGGELAETGVSKNPAKVGFRQFTPTAKLFGVDELAEVHPNRSRQFESELAVTGGSGGADAPRVFGLDARAGQTGHGASVSMPDLGTPPTVRDGEAGHLPGQKYPPSRTNRTFGQTNRTSRQNPLTPDTSGDYVSRHNPECPVSMSAIFWRTSADYSAGFRIPPAQAGQTRHFGVCPPSVIRSTPISIKPQPPRARGQRQPHPLPCPATRNAAQRPDFGRTGHVSDRGMVGMEQNLGPTVDCAQWAKAFTGPSLGVLRDVSPAISASVLPTPDEWTTRHNAAADRRAALDACRPAVTIADLRTRMAALIATLSAAHQPIPGAPPDPALAVRRATLAEAHNAIRAMLDALPVEREEVMRG